MSKSKKKTAAKGAPQIKKDGKGRFWVVPKDGGKEQGPFETKQQANEAKAALASGSPAPEAATAKSSKKAGKAKKAKEPKEKKGSALDAAAQVLAGSKEPMNTKAMIEVMTKRSLWTSPGGKTPHATLYSAIIREIAEKGKDARFKKTDRGQFASNG